MTQWRTEKRHVQVISMDYDLLLLLRRTNISIFAPDIPELLYYSHIPATILALLVGIFVFVNNPRNLLNKILLSIALSFSAITVINLVT